MVGPNSFQVSDAGALVFWVGGVLLGVSKHFGEGHFHMLLYCSQVEIPVKRKYLTTQHSLPYIWTIATKNKTHLVLKYMSVVSRVDGE